MRAERVCLLLLCASLVAPAWARGAAEPAVQTGDEGRDREAPSPELLEFLGGLMLLEGQLLGPDQAADLPDPDFLGTAPGGEPRSGDPAVPRAAADGEGRT